MVSQEQNPGSAAPSESVAARFRRWIVQGDTWGELAGVLAVVLGGVVVAMMVFAVFSLLAVAYLVNSQAVGASNPYSSQA